MTAHGMLAKFLAKSWPAQQVSSFFKILAYHDPLHWALLDDRLTHPITRAYVIYLSSPLCQSELHLLYHSRGRLLWLIVWIPLFSSLKYFLCFCRICSILNDSVASIEIGHILATNDVNTREYEVQILSEERGCATAAVTGTCSTVTSDVAGSNLNVVSCQETCTGDKCNDAWRESSFWTFLVLEDHSKCHPEIGDPTGGEKSLTRDPWTIGRNIQLVDFVTQHVCCKLMLEKTKNRVFCWKLALHKYHDYLANIMTAVWFHDKKIQQKLFRQWWFS